MINNLQELIQKFSNEQDCRAFLVQQRWNGSPVCPYCGCEKWYSIENGKRFKCGSKDCYKKYSVTVGTVFEASNIPLTKWFPAMYILTAHKKGISSIQLSKDLGVTQKTAWFMIHRIRESLKDKNSTLLSGTVEIDESYIGGDVKNMHKKKRESLKNRYNPQLQKQGLMGLVERGGKLKVSLIPGKDYKGTVLKEMVREAVDKNAIIITDGFGGYAGLHKEYQQHEVINHAKQEYVRGQYHTNTIEGFWSYLKRSIYGIYHSVSVKHLQRYCDENAYRYNLREMKDGERFIFALSHVTGRLSYKQQFTTEIRKDAANRSSKVLLGKVSEHLIPYSEYFGGLNPRDAKFIGSPIDFIVFDGASEDDGDVTIHFVEIKTGKSGLTPVQKRIKSALDAMPPRIEWKVISLKDFGDEVQKDFDAVL